jgi:hypothetical protein
MSALVGNSFFLGAGASAGGYEISRSLRFDQASSSYLSRTPASAGNRKTWTLSFWVKRGASTGSDIGLFSTYSGSNPATTAYFNSSDGITFYNYSGSYQFQLITTQVFRDYSAWYHLVFVVDTTQATASDRVKLYVNGVQVTTFSTETYPSQNVDTDWNSTTEHQIGNHATYFSGYLADIYFVDGLALSPSIFGEFDATTGVWNPIAPTEITAYGTNGFHLELADNSAATATTLGKDSSGNGNNWTPYNFTVAAPAYSAPTNNNTPVYEITIGPTNPLSGTYIWSNAFDGTTSTTGLIGPITFTGTKPTWSTSTGVELMADGNGITASVNGGSYVSLTNNAYVTISSGSSGTLSTIYIDSPTSASYIKSVRVDGVDISVKALVGFARDIDSLVDVPINGSEVDTGLGNEVRGNYCTWNPLEKGANATLANGNLDASFSAASLTSSTIGLSSGKWYWEVTVTATNPMIGIIKQGANLASYPGSDSSGWGYSTADGYKYNAGSGSAYGATATTNDVIGVAFDADNGTLTYYKNNTSQGTAFTGLTSGPYFPAVGRANGTPSVAVNFGQRSWAYQAPSGFKALNTASLPAPLVTKPSTVMDVALYTGTGSSLTVSSLGFSPDLVWLKSRGAARNHRLTDTVRGATIALQSDLTSAEVTEANGLTAFNSNGFTVGSHPKRG